MSIKLLSAAWDLDIGSTEKMVLMSLCDFANDQGVCWPSVATICRKTSKSERTVQTALKWLRDNGYFSVEGYNGVTPRYYLDPRKICTPAEIAPPQKLRKTPAKSAPKPLRTPKSISKRTHVDKPESVSDEVWRDWLSHRKAEFSATALKGFEREAAIAGWSLERAITEAIERGWQGFKASWVKEKNNGTGSRAANQSGKSQDGFTTALRQVADGGFDEPFGAHG